MALNRISAALAGAVFAAMPALAEDAPPAAPTAPAAAAAPAAPATTGRVYIAYPTQPHGDFPSQLAVDDAWQANPVAPGSCVYFELPPGDHSVHTLVDPTINLTLAAGESKYIELHIRHLYVQGKPEDSIFPKSVAAIDNAGACAAGPAP